MSIHEKKIAIVVQRAGEDIVGGSEGYALSLAKILAASCSVDIITTTAKDHVTWKNVYPEGISQISDSLRIIRFNAAFERGTYWFELDRIMTRNVSLDVFESMPPQERAAFINFRRSMPLGLGEEWIKHQGPYSPSLLNYISDHEAQYDRFLFMTYLYPTTYFGIDRVSDPRKISFVPTYHDESPAYLPNFLKYRKYEHLFLTNAEKNIAEHNLYCSEVNSRVIGFGIDDKLDTFARTPGTPGEKYVLYAGRIEAAKGVHHLFKFFERYSSEQKDVKLYLIGDGILKGYRHKNIVYKGFVSESEKLQLMRGAVAFIHPSAFESLGIVLLESFMMGTPALVNKRSDVLREHIENSQAGYIYDNYEDFHDALNVMVNDCKTRERLSRNARDYFCGQYSLSAYKTRLTEVLQ
jgi:glycosyltransferase involved in cell wall biosynthesis